MTEGNCEVCKYKDEQTGEHCYACVKGYKNNFEEEMLTRETACDKVEGEWIETLELFDDEEYPRKISEEEMIIKKAEWIEDGYYDLPCVCSYCGKEGNYKMEYCPNCGAKMEE